MGGAGMTEKDKAAREFASTLTARTAKERLDALRSALLPRRRGRPRGTHATYYLPRDGVEEMKLHGIFRLNLSRRLRFVVQKVRRAAEMRKGGGYTGELLKRHVTLLATQAAARADCAGDRNLRTMRRRLRKEDAAARLPKREARKGKMQEAWTEAELLASAMVSRI